MKLTKTSSLKLNPQYELNISESYVYMYSLFDIESVNCKVTTYILHKSTTVEYCVVILGCSSLPVDREGLAPSTIVRVRSYKQADHQAQATIGHTEIVQVYICG